MHDEEEKSKSSLLVTTNEESEPGVDYFIPAAVPLGYTSEFTLYWSNLVISEARIGFVSRDSKHPFIDYLKGFLSEQRHLLIQFTTEELETTDDDSIDIWSFEMSPTTEGEVEYEKVRMRWTQLYIKLLCLLNGRERQNFVPPVAYSPHLEGPMGSYIRTVQEMPDSEDKKLLQTHFEKLKCVKWRRGEKEGFVYKVEGNTPNEMLESFLLGAWSIFIYASQKQDILPICYLVQFIEEMLPELPLEANSDGAIKQEILSEITHMLSDLTFPTPEFPEMVPLACMVIHSPRLFPIPVARATHVFFDEITVDDCDMKEYVNGLDKLEDNHVLWSNRQHLQVLKLCLDMEENV